jgi:hypothetical protein
MARQLQITCDQCGKPKGDSNHWWQAIRTIHTNPSGAVGIELIAGSCIPDKTAVDLCGAECVLKFVAGKLSETK